MKRSFKIWFLLLAILVLQACVGKDRQEREVIHQAELLMQEQPDSALHLLQTLQRYSLTGETLALMTTKGMKEIQIQMIR